MQKLILSIVLLFSTVSLLNGQNRPTDVLQKEDRIGVTGMFKYVNNSWDNSRKAKYGDLNFDSFRVWAQTDIEDVFFASAQYRFYEGWNTPQHLYVGFHYKNTTIKIGHTWVPFGMNWQPYDDWGNIAFYTGFQDDNDYGVTWSIPYNNFIFDLGFFKNQQLSSASNWRYDADIYSGDEYVAGMKANEETNQFNVNARYFYDFNGFTGKVGASGMFGQIYNIDVDDFGSRLAFTGFGTLNKGVFHVNVQNINYNFEQVLASGVPQTDKDFINMACWAIAYSMPSKANIFSSSVAVGIIGEKLVAHCNYSLLSGGTSLANSWLFTSGIRSNLGALELMLEGYYGVGDPQFSGNVEGYGIDNEIKDFRVDLRVYYKLSILKKKQVVRGS